MANKKSLWGTTHWIRKIAGSSTSFNETVPSTASDTQDVEDQGNKPAFKNAQVDNASDPYAAVPQGYEDPNQQPDMMQEGMQAPPEMIGAAQSFLGPEVMQAAMSGDANAADLIARTAAHVGSNFMNMSNNAAVPVMPGMDQQMGQGIGGVEPAGSVPAGITSPEEDLASELVPAVMPAQQGAMQQGGIPQQDIPGQEQEGQEQENQEENGQVAGQSQIPGNSQEQGNGQMVDIDTVSKLINLAKAGKI